MKRRFRKMTTRDRVLEELKEATRNSLRRPPDPPAEPICKCPDCKLARARDVTPNPRILLVQPAELERMYELADGLGLMHSQLVQLTQAMFGKAPSLLREVEAAAVIAHLERRDI